MIGLEARRRLREASATLSAIIDAGERPELRERLEGVRAKIHSAIEDPDPRAWAVIKVFTGDTTPGEKVMAVYTGGDAEQRARRAAKALEGHRRDPRAHYRVECVEEG